MTNVCSLHPRKTAQLLGMGMTPRTVTATTSAFIPAGTLPSGGAKRKPPVPGRSSESEEADPPVAGLGEDRRLVEDDDLAGLEGCRLDPRLAQGGERPGPETGHVESVVLDRLDRLDQEGAV